MMIGPPEPCLDLDLSLLVSVSGQSNQGSHHTQVTLLITSEQMMVMRVKPRDINGISKLPRIQLILPYLKNHFSHKGFIGSQTKCFMAISNPQ